jgi:hypothetical protein
MTVMPPIEWPTSTTGPPRDHLVEHEQQVLAELVDGRRLRRPAAAAAVRPVVVQHQAQVVTGQGQPLVVPDGHLLDVAVQQHDGQRGVRPADLLDVQRHAVRGDHRAGAVRRQAEERLLPLGVRSQPGAADGVPLGCQPDRGADRHDAHRGAQDALAREVSAGVDRLHCRCTRGTRAPTRVTTS